MKKGITLFSIFTLAVVFLTSFKPSDKVSTSDLSQFMGEQKVGVLDTLGITNGSVHMKGVYLYKDFVKKYKGSNPKVTIHIWYNQTSSTLSKKEIKAGKDEIYFLYGRNLKKGAIEMEFKFGSKAKEAFRKKRAQDLMNLVDLFNFDIFGNENFSASMCHEALNEALE